MLNTALGLAGDRFCLIAGPEVSTVGSPVIGIMLSRRRAHSAEGEKWFVFIEVVDGKLEAYPEPEYKMRNLAESPAVTLEPFKSMLLQELVVARLAESKREEGRN